MKTIQIDYTPRPLQVELHKMLDQNRFNVLVMHRRFGKTVCAINHLLKRAIEEQKPNPRLAYIAPTYRQAKNVAWDYLKQFSSKIPGTRYHETELRCDLPNGARISLLGSENPSSLRYAGVDLSRGHPPGTV
jgi:phage terminase large subunit-like protein